MQYRSVSARKASLFWIILLLSLPVFERMMIEQRCRGTDWSIKTIGRLYNHDAAAAVEIGLRPTG